MILRISRDRIILYGSALAVLNVVVAACIWIRGYFNDWQAFFTAGSLAGTRMLLDPFAWQRAHHLIPSPFVYTPGFAWLYIPFAHMTLREGAIVNATLIGVFGSASALVAAKLYAFPKNWALLVIFAWAPVGAALLVDQNSVFGVLLVFLAIAGLCGKYSLLGLAVGVLLYKPQYALPWIVLLLFRREWRALLVTAACAAGWYALSFLATGMDRLWVPHWITVVRNYLDTDFTNNADKTISLPGLLHHIGVPEFVAVGVGVLGFVYVAYRLRNAGPLEAGSFITLAGLACSPHAWDYDAVLVLPAIFWTLTHVSEPLRTRAIIVAYAIAPLWLFAHPLHFDMLAVSTIGGVVLWLRGDLGCAEAAPNGVPARGEHAIPHRNFDENDRPG